MSEATQLWLCLYLPRLGLEIFTRSRADGAEKRPVALVDGPQASRQQLLQLNAAARARGLTPGMGLATAESICADLLVAVRNAEDEQATLERLAIWAYRFTPRVTAEAGHGCLLLELSGSLRLFRGLDRLQTRALEGLRGLGYSALPGVAPTPLAARALALAGSPLDVDRLAAELELQGGGDDMLRRSWCEAVDQAARRALERLPLSCLRRPRTENERFEAMGLETVGDLLRLPPAPLGRRFGAALLDHLDRLTGRRADPRDHVRLPERFESKVHFLEDLEHTTALVFPMRRLVDELADWLRLRQLATDRLQWQLSHPRHGSRQLSVHFATPQREADRMLEFSRLQLDREQGPGKRGALPLVATLELRVQRLQRQSGEVTGLFAQLGDARSAGQDPAHLVDLLHARFGRGVCHAVVACDDHRPERAWRHRPPGTASAASSRVDGAAPSASGGPPGPRPLWLLSSPRRLAEQDGQPLCHGPLELLRGPERIAVGWWDDAVVVEDAAPATSRRNDAPEAGSAASEDDAADPDRRSDAFDAAAAQLGRNAGRLPSSATREYWVARRRDGGICWVYFDHATDAWFLHGIFS